MNKQINEPSNTKTKSKKLPDGLDFRLANFEDTSSITELTYLRNPNFDLNKLPQKVTKEISYNLQDRPYRLYVAVLKDEVIGFCRFYHSSEVTAQKRLFDSPEGFYCMGTIISPKYRRHNVARFLAENRFLEIKKLGANFVYSSASGDNKASVKMHETFGYERVANVPGVLQVKFECGYGYLYKKDITD